MKRCLLLKFLPAIACILSLAACASTTLPGEGIKVGMTKQEVIAVAGKPQAQQTMTGMFGLGVDKSHITADETWTYNNANDPSHFIPIVNIFSGMNLKMKTVYFLNGKVKGVDTTSMQ